MININDILAVHVVDITIAVASVVGGVIVGIDIYISIDKI